MPCLLPTSDAITNGDEISPQTVHKKDRKHLSRHRSLRNSWDTSFAESSVPPGHQALDDGNSGEVVVYHRHHQHQQLREACEKHLLFHLEAEVAPRETFERHD